MNTSLAIPTKIQNTAPKPTKSQLVEALLLRAREAHQKAEEAKTVKREALVKEAEQLVLSGLKSIKISEWAVDLRESWSERYPATISADFRSPKLSSLRDRINKLRSSRFDTDSNKKLITEKLKTPNPLLGNDDAAKSLDQLLATIMDQPKLEAVDI